MKKLKFEFIFAPSYDPKMKRSYGQTSKIQNKWDARKQRRMLQQETQMCVSASSVKRM